MIQLHSPRNLQQQCAVHNILDCTGLRNRLEAKLLQKANSELMIQRFGVLALGACRAYQQISNRLDTAEEREGSLTTLNLE